ncbi:TlpA family protein disulfide reductase [Flavobacterium sp. ANB]|uniref:TlpA family protein disulfide reductase n=1 Tax=unclassified Flavobacterium TaxID=196869 RepID=UPI0012B8E271|nr:MULTISPECIES: TlpA disulfide reductase family protein [unclassified Flavobacterium]MBF4518774.1 TlpA family protein disulfide reductase [Flavobacterium sp. ANB]MTD71513.1 redoxin domain-containing protein [Flavobacterium sp. LC2016-13]
MKKKLILLFITFINIAFSQTGKVYLKDSKFKFGKENTYVYEPPIGIEIPDQSRASVAYSTSNDFGVEFKKIIKKAGFYEFAVKVPDSCRVILLTINNNQKVIDDNQEKGYSVLLRTQNKTELGKTLADEIAMRNLGSFSLKLKTDTKPENMVRDYEVLFAKYPNLKNDKSFYQYLVQKERINKDKTKSEFLAFAQKCINKNTEEYLILASNIYGRTEMVKEKEILDQKILKKYPCGELEKTKFLQEFFSNPNKTEASVLASMNTIKTKYHDTSESTLFTFNYFLMNIYLQNKDLEKIVNLESTLKNKVAITSSYNQTAWELSGADLTTPANDLEFAQKISKRSLDILDENQKVASNPDYESMYNMFSDTYALILYKLGDYDGAFKYQEIVRGFNGFDSGGKERYLTYMQKVKSKDEVNKYIENEINNDQLVPAAFLSALKTNYTSQNIPLDKYEKLKQKADLLTKTKLEEAVIARFGSATASNFSLKNLEGKQVNLSDYKGKVVVLDFWATWCGPCKASFPKMQELVTKYKGKNVEFLFVNTFEKGKEEDTFKKVNTYISDKKYSFNVIFDYKTDVATNYKIESIPTKILIDKNGKILTGDASDSTLTDLIDQQLN